MPGYRTPEFLTKPSPAPPRIVVVIGDILMPFYSGIQ